MLFNFLHDRLGRLVVCHVSSRVAPQNIKGHVGYSGEQNMRHAEKELCG
jgi:hypothetical protein